MNDTRLHSRLAVSEAKRETLCKEQQHLLEELKNTLDENNRQSRAGNAACAKISEMLRPEWIRGLGKEMKSFMSKIFFTNVAIYKAVLEIRGRLPSSLERSLCQEPFILEDSIGRVTPVSLEFVNSWEAFDAVLEIRFRGLQGFEEVQKKEYVIQAGATRREIHRSRPLECSFLPGQTFVMSMLFQDSGLPPGWCPSCHTSSDGARNADVKWWVLPAFLLNGTDYCIVLIVEYGIGESRSTCWRINHLESLRHLNSKRRYLH